MEIINDIILSLKKGDAGRIMKDIETALELGIEPEKILKNGLLSAINIVGDKYKKNEIFVPEVLLATRAMNAGMKVLEPYLLADKTKHTGRVLIGTIKGDLHDIGKNLVKVTLEREGFEVKDLGKDVSVEEFIRASMDFEPHVIGISTLLTSTMVGLKDVIVALDRAGIRRKILVMVGGVPITERFAMGIGADIYAYDAGEAASVLKTRLGRVG